MVAKNFEEAKIIDAYALGTNRYSILAHDLDDAECPLMRHSFGRYINHSAKHSNLKLPQWSNLGSASKPFRCVLFQAQRDIYPNEELFYDYSGGFGEKSPDLTDFYNFGNPSFYNDCYCKLPINANTCFKFLTESKFKAEYEIYRNELNSIAADQGEIDPLFLV